MSDGEPSDTISQSSLNLIKNSGVVFHSVCYGSRINALEKLTAAGHGEIYYATEVDRLLEIFTEIGLNQIIDGPDSDGDGLLDWVIGSGDKDHIKDPYRLKYNHFINLGSGDYMADLITRFENSDYYKYVYPYEPLHNNPLVDDEPPKYYETIVNLMMSDVNTSELHDLIAFEYWDSFCEFFNYNLIKCGGINSERHYFRNKLNRAPSSLSELICQSEKWTLCKIEDSRYHINGIDGEYNLKFISLCGKYEAVYNKYGELLTETNDPVNMGTYNYANYMTDLVAHTIYDVLPYQIIHGNVVGVGPSLSSTKKYYKNLNAQNYRSELVSILNCGKDQTSKQDAYKKAYDKYIK